MQRPRSAALAALLIAVVLASAGVVSLTGDRPAPEPELQFRQAASSAGLNYTSQGGGTGQAGMTRGGGVFVNDFNDDDWPDVLLIGGTARQTERGWVGVHPALYENVGGEFRRSHALPQSEIDRRLQSAVFFDYDADGDEDLLLLPITGEPYLLENAGGEFELRDVGLDVNLTEPAGATVADYDRDGCLDLFVYQNGQWSEHLPKGYHKPNQNVTDDNGNPNLLFQGDCSGFTRVEDAGISGERWTLAASFVDLTGDGRPDIHVANDYNADYIYVNQGDGTFAQRQLGVSTRRNAMSSEVADVNRDGRPDLYVTNIYFDNASGGSVDAFKSHLGRRMAGNNLLINQGNGSFADRAEAYGLRKGGWGWAASVTDLDNDGDRDLIHTTETFRESVSGNESYYRYPAVFERTGRTSFVPRDASTLGFNRTDGAGIATVDYDRDGDRDVVIGVADRSARTRFALYENVGAAGNWLEVVVERPAGLSLGTEVTVVADNRTYWRVKNAKVDFHSQGPRTLHVGLGNRTGPVDLRVTWPNGTTETHEDVTVNRRVVVRPNEPVRNATAGG